MRRLAIAVCAALWLAAAAGAVEAPADAVARGSAALERRDLAGAHAAFEAAVAADPTDARALLLLGMTELELGRPDAAIARFAAARALDARIAQRALVHEGLAHAQAGRRNEARAAFEAAIALDASSALAGRARALLDAGAPAPARRYHLSGSFGLEFEDNVTVSEIDESSGQGDGAAVAELSGSYRLLDGERGGLEAGYDFSQSVHFRLSEADLQTHGVWLDGTREIGGLEAGLGARFDGVLLGGDGLLLLQEVRPRLAVALRPGWTAEPFAAYAHKDFLESDDRDRDAHRASAGVENRIRLADGRARVRLGLRFDSEQARGAEFDYLGGALSTGVRVPFEWRGRWGADLGYQLRLRDYRHDTPEIGEPRRDLEQGVRVGLAREITRRLEARLEYRLTDTDSNLPSADALENAVGLRLRVDL